MAFCAISGLWCEARRLNDGVGSGTGSGLPKESITVALWPALPIWGCGAGLIEKVVSRIIVGVFACSVAIRTHPGTLAARFWNALGTPREDAALHEQRRHESDQRRRG